MKRDPTIRRVVDRMRPGVLCRDGFLGSDRRRLEEIIETDRSTVVGLGTTHEAIAERLEAVYGRARAGLGTPVAIDGRLTAVWREAMGRIPCPWGGCGTFPKGEVELTDVETGQSLLLTPLSIHQVAAHGFYQGRGARYRVEPELACRLLGLGGQP